MEQFSLEEYLRLKEEGKEPKIVTREGRPARIICTDADNQTFPVVALIHDLTPDAVEEPFTFTPDGHYHSCKCNDLYDLFFAPTKHEGWIILWRYNNDTPVSGNLVFDNKEEALEWRRGKLFPCWVAKVEWTE